MKNIRVANTTVSDVLGVQEPAADARYRRSDFCVLASVDGVAVAHHTLTGRIDELSDAEAAILQESCTFATEETKALIENWYLVPQEHDEVQLADEVLGFVRMFEKNKGFKRYTIMSTMDCNARCFYCYELGRPRIPMSMETADAVVAYIQKTRKDGEIRLAWFGGEPLYNAPAIDRITQGLQESGVPFFSTMISNGYLFDDALADKAVAAWKLKRVQITLDGTEAVYNKAKAYVDSAGKNPFRIVTDNIERLLKRGVFVTVRLNMGEHNKEDLFTLADFLAARYQGYKNLSVYVQMLFETEKDKKMPDLRLSLAKDLLDLEDKLQQLGIAAPRLLRSGISTNQCMADSPASITVMPTGKIGKCEHFSEDEFIGDVYTGITDLAKVAEFRERGNSKELCAGCSAYPVCIKLKKCPEIASTVCNAPSRLIEEVHIKRSLEHTYRRIKEQEKKKAE